MISKPLVSILLPVHNSEKFLRDCLQSLVSQSYRNIEIVAIDDQSSDKSYKILKRFKKNYPPAGRQGKKIRIYRNVKRYGIVMTLNRLLRRAKAEFIAFMDSDDIAKKGRIKKQLEFLLKNPNVVAVGTQCYFVNRKNISKGRSSFPFDSQDIYNSPLHGLSMQFETVMINKNLLPKDILKFDFNANPFIYSDFLIKLLPYGKFSNLPNFLHSHRNNPKTYLSDIQRNIFSLIKLIFRGNAFYKYQPSIRLFLSSLLRTNLKTSPGKLSTFFGLSRPI